MVELDKEAMENAMQFVPGADPTDCYRIAEQVVTAYLEAAGMTWRPISEAPKEGTHVLLSCRVDPPSGFVCEGYYEEVRDGWWSANTHWTDAYDGQVDPTHFMPLPASPKETP